MTPKIKSTTDANTEPSKLSLRRERVRHLGVQSNLRTGGGRVGPGTTACGLTNISCEVTVLTIG